MRFGKLIKIFIFFKFLSYDIGKFQEYKILIGLNKLIFKLLMIHFI